jgi:hypothetical protein
MSTEFLNGVRNYYGPRVVEDLYGAEIKTSGNVRQLEWVFNFDDLPANQAEGASILIPANSIIKAFTVYVITALVGTTPVFTAGTEDVAGGGADPNGFVTATEGASGLLDADGDIVNGAGALVGLLVPADTVGTNLIVEISGSPTAGRFHCVLEYMMTRT